MRVVWAEVGGLRMNITAVCTREGVNVAKRSMRWRVSSRWVGVRESGVRRRMCRVG